MAETTIAELLRRSSSDTVNHRGRIVRAVVRIPVRDGSTVRIERISVGSSRNQAIKLAVPKGALDVNGRRAPEIALWSHTSPDVVELVVRSSGATSLEVWNAWSMGGVDSSWIGNAGIVTKTVDDGQHLQCSDGIGDASFSDLVIAISVAR